MGALWVVLPELFTTGLAFDDAMLDGHRSLRGEPMQMLKELAREGESAIGGSYLAEDGGHVYNTFVLATPEGVYEFRTVQLRVTLHSLTGAATPTLRSVVAEALVAGIRGVLRVHRPH